MSFYMYLPSNVKHINDKFIYGDDGDQSQNTTSNYTTQLAETKHFHKPYEVAVVDFSYRHSWKLDFGKLTVVFDSNLKSDIIESDVKNLYKEKYNPGIGKHPWYSVPDVDLTKDERKLKYIHNFELIDDQLIQVFPLFIMDGEDLYQFLDRLEIEIQQFYMELIYNNRYDIYKKKKIKYPGYSYDAEIDALEPYDKKIFWDTDNKLLEKIKSEATFRGLPSFSLGPNGYKIFAGPGIKVQFSGAICRILKIPQDSIVFKKKYTDTFAYHSLLTTSKSINLTQMLFIYTDIISLQIVGDTRASLIRTVHVENDHQKGSFISFDNPQYFPINKTEINSVNIRINDETGKQVQFIDSLVSVTLHFRPIIN